MKEKELRAANLQACAYNAAVNYGSARGHKKMMQLIDVINSNMRFEGKEAMDHLVKEGVVESYKPCPPECGMRPGGLFHAANCENDANHPVYRARVRAATERLPGGADGHAGWRIATVSLVGI